MSPAAPTETVEAQLASALAAQQALASECETLRTELASTRQTLDWLKRQLFRRKSEKRLDLDPAVQADLLASLGVPVPLPSLPAPEQPARKRGPKQRPAGTVTDTGLRFDDAVPVRDVVLPCPEIEGLEPSQYERIGEKVTYRLGQRAASYEVIRLVRPVVKILESGAIVTPPAAPAVLDKSLADVSLLAGMLCDKFLHHLPLHRQHQRMALAGITLSRQTLTVLASRAIDLLQPIVDAQRAHVLQSRVLALDETGIKAGRVPGRKGKMKQGWFWPMYGEDDEIVFTYTDSKSTDFLKVLLAGWPGGTLLSDGAGAYVKYADKLAAVTLSNCWAHTRREFEWAEASNPAESAAALALIGEIYRHEAAIRAKGLEDEACLAYRTTHIAPVVSAFWAWCEAQVQRGWTSVDRIGKALKYALTRRANLEVFLTDPEVAVDTNHLERALRPIPMGRKAWLFCWTELGAANVAAIQSLLVTCRLQGVHPYTYLVDVLQRIDRHPAHRVEELTPRLWKTHFAGNPLRSMLDPPLVL